MAIRFLTAGESHGPALTVIVEGLPAGVPIDPSALDRDLRRRMGGYGRGGRMKIERDAVEILGGIRFGSTGLGPCMYWYISRIFPGHNPFGSTSGVGRT